jgi:hypothetical protein
MKSLFLLIDEAKQKYYSSNAEFQNKVDVMLSMLRSVGAVPYRRKKLNGHVLSSYLQRLYMLMRVTKLYA